MNTSGERGGRNIPGNKFSRQYWGHQLRERKFEKMLRGRQVGGGDKLTEQMFCGDRWFGQPSTRRLIHEQLSTEIFIISRRNNSFVKPNFHNSPRCLEERDRGDGGDGGGVILLSTTAKFP